MIAQLGSLRSEFSALRLLILKMMKSTSAEPVAAEFSSEIDRRERNLIEAYETGSCRQIKRAFDALHSLAPDNPNLLWTKRYATTVPHDENRILLQRAVTQLPQCPYAHYERALSLANVPEDNTAEARRKSNEESNTELSNAIALKGDEIGWKYQRGFLQHELRRFDEACVTLTDVLDHYPRHSFALRLRADCYRKRGRSSEADMDDAIADLTDGTARKTLSQWILIVAAAGAAIVFLGAYLISSHFLWGLTVVIPALLTGMDEMPEHEDYWAKNPRFTNMVPPPNPYTFNKAKSRWFAFPAPSAWLVTGRKPYKELLHRQKNARTTSN